MNQEILKQADELMHEVAASVFFQKLATYGLQPSNDEEADFLLETGQTLLQQYPFAAENVVKAKTAALGAECKVAADGYSEESHRWTDELMKDQPVVAAASMLLTAQTI